eukprot:1149912-Pelagomonas_calceolata.AAC.3
MWRVAACTAHVLAHVSAATCSGKCGSVLPVVRPEEGGRENLHPGSQVLCVCFPYDGLISQTQTLLCCYCCCMGSGKDPPNLQDWFKRPVSGVAEDPSRVVCASFDRAARGVVCKCSLWGPIVYFSLI